MKWAILFLVILISCAPVSQEIGAKPVVTQPEPPKPVPLPVLEPEVKAPQEVAPPQPVIIRERTCNELCEENCKSTAQNACTQKERSRCKDVCGDNLVIDPSACTQACTYITQPNQCKLQMERFCSANCVKQCH